MIKGGAVNGVNFLNGEIFSCEGCCYGKMHKRSFKLVNHDEENYKISEFFHSDTCGPMQESSIGGTRYFLSFIDHASNYRIVYFL